MIGGIRGLRWPATLCCLFALVDLCRSQTVAVAEPWSRGGFSAGMGVISVNAADVVELVNSTAGVVDRAPSFKSGVEFFGAASIPVSRDWLVKVEYAYQLASFNTIAMGGPAEFTVSIHCPTVIAQYVLVERGLYNLKLGAGAGYSVGSLSERYVYIDDSFSGSGPSLVLDLEANTAFGENFYAFLGANARWQLIGELSDRGGRSPGIAADGNRPALHVLGVGARLGFTYYVF
jgi:hypothetical protein